MRLVLLDQTGGATCTDGSKLTPEILTHFAEAYTIQMNRDYAPEYGGNFQTRVGASPTDLEAGEWPFAFLPTLEDAPGAIAFHSSSGNGMPLLYDGITLSATVNGPGNSASVAGSHEYLETAQDEGANVWCDDGSGNEHAREVADPVENRAYKVTCADGFVVWVSDFVLKAWFVPARVGPYSFMASQNLEPDGSQPLTTINGYQITRTADPSTEKSGMIVTVHGERKRRPDGSRRSRARGD